ncbi:MAG: filamentous hemagglutinin N-terminal domain-containing protein, partial [Leptolyngbyaceae cyanobacterium]
MLNPSLLYRVTLASSVSLLATLCHGLTAIADIVPANDGTGTTVEQNGQHFTIRDGTRAETNQFHSFGEFNLTADQIAEFQTLLGTENVFGRVTSGAASLINGRIELTGSNANLFLMNPAGMIFGEGTSLNVPGSFMATTATGIGFGDGQWFSAIGTNDYASLVGNPNAFAFTTDHPGALVNSGDLAVAPGESLTLMGGTVINTGTLTAPGGTITIAAIEGNNLVRISQENSLLILELETTDGALINNPRLPNALPFTPLDLPALLTGGNTTHATDIIANADGTISLTNSPYSIPVGPGMAIASGTLNTNSPTQNSQLNTQNSPTPQLPNSPSPQINVLGDRTLLLNATLSADGPTGGGTVRIGGDYQGAGPVFNASQTVIDSQSSISANALDRGDGGRVIVWADGETGFFGEISARGGENSGNGGFVEVSGKQDLVFRGNVDVSAPNGAIGTLLLDPENITIVNGNGAANDDDLIDNQILNGETPGATFTISEVALEGLADNATIILEATNDITVNDLADNNLSLPTIFEQDPSGAQGQSLYSVQFRADSDQDGAGSFSMNPGDTISTNGGDLTIEAAFASIGGLDANFISIESGEIDFIGGTDSIIGTRLLLRSAALNQNITVGDTDNTTAALDITQTDLDAIQDGLSGLVFASGNGDISVIGDINFQSPLMTFNASRTDAANTGEGSIDVQGANITARAIDMFANNGITIDNSNLTSEIRNNFNGDFDGIDGGAVAITNSTITTNDNITISGVGTAALPNGILIDNSDINVGAGSLNLTGSGYDGADITDDKNGILISGGSLLESSGNGDITLDGTGGNGENFNRGIYVTGSTLRVENGVIDLTGTGQGSKRRNIGIQLSFNVLAEATGNGSIIFNGTGGSEVAENINDGDILNDNVGIWISNTARLETITGDIELEGTGGGSGNGISHYGIFLYSNAEVISADGNITLDGTGGNGPNNYRGIAIGGPDGTGALLGSTVATTGTGNITLTGRGGPGDRSAVGVEISTASEVSTTDGQINITGIGGNNGTDFNRGILFTRRVDPNSGELAEVGGSIRSVNGDINLVGIGNGAGGSNHGVHFAEAGSVESGGISSVNGNVTITGTGGGTTNNNSGIYFQDSGVIETTGNGAIALSGTSGNGTENNRGIALLNVA